LQEATAEVAAASREGGEDLSRQQRHHRPCGEARNTAVPPTDEAWASIVDGEKRVMIDNAKAVGITVPAEAQAFPGGRRGAYHHVGRRARSAARR